MSTICDAGPIRNSSSKWISGIVLNDLHGKTTFKRKTKLVQTFPIRSNQTIERKKAEARAERELAARKREDARRAKDEVSNTIFDQDKELIFLNLGKNQAERRREHG